MYHLQSQSKSWAVLWGVSLSGPLHTVYIFYWWSNKCNTVSKEWSSIPVTTMKYGWLRKKKASILNVKDEWTRLLGKMKKDSGKLQLQISRQLGYTFAVYNNLWSVQKLYSKPSSYPLKKKMKTKNKTWKFEHPYTCSARKAIVYWMKLAVWHPLGGGQP